MKKNMLPLLFILSASGILLTGCSDYDEDDIADAYAEGSEDATAAASTALESLPKPRPRPAL